MWQIQAQAACRSGAWSDDLEEKVVKQDVDVGVEERQGATVRRLAEVLGLMLLPSALFTWLSPPPAGICLPAQL
ncbi:hypothetical protein AOLI_G00203820 [Acnodon oligacanthus]